MPPKIRYFSFCAEGKGGALVYLGGSGQVSFFSETKWKLKYFGFDKPWSILN